MKIFYCLIVIIVLTTLAYCSVPSNEFTRYDDDINIYENPYFYPINLDNTLHFWKHTYEHLYIPVSYTAWAALGRLSNFFARSQEGQVFNPHIYHSANLVVHVLNALVVFVLLLHLVKNHWAACAGALLFALHPVQVETVAWASGFRDVLSGLFSLVAIWCFIVYATGDPRNEKSGCPPRRYYVYALCFFLCAMLAKPSAVVIPAVLFILAYIIFTKPVKQSIKEALPFCVIAVPLVVTTKLSQPDAQMSFAPSFVQWPLILGDTLTFYVSKLVWPLMLGPDYGRTPLKVLESSWVYVTGTVPFALLGVVLWRYRRPLAMAAIGIFLIAVLPVSGVVPFNFQNISTTADRYLYVAMFGPSLAVAWGLSVYKGRALLYLCFCGILLLGMRTFFQATYWQNSRSLFEHALTVNPNSSIAHNNLGVEFYKQRRYEEAFKHFKRAVALNPGHDAAYVNLGVLAAMKNDQGAALEYYSKALERNPAHGRAHNNMANAYVKTGRYEEAMKHYNKALSLVPELAPGIYFNMGVLYEQQGQTKEALDYYVKAFRLNPNFGEAQENHQRLMQQGVGRQP